jgi:hypothetical protein
LDFYLTHVQSLLGKLQTTFLSKLGIFWLVMSSLDLFGAAILFPLSLGINETRRENLAQIKWT